ncbi:unnamed protein product [Rhizophagus irregularis]|nr:unnamed protein product [Rhizophagus irregularis]
MIGQMWRNEDEREKLRWAVLADKEKLKHAQDYPDYVYRPRRSTKRKSNDKPDKSISGPIDRSTTTHGILHDHWSSSSTNHMTSHYAQHPSTLEVYNYIPISQCFNYDYSFNNFDTTSISYNGELFYYNPITSLLSTPANPTNGELFYYNPTTSSSSTMLEDLETYFDESVSLFSAVVEGHYEY